MPVWLAHSQLDYGRFLAGAAAAADVERARRRCSAAALATAERLGMAHGRGAARAAARRARPPPRPAPDAAGLTEREVDVLRLIAEGRSNRDIGARLHISQHTAANHVRSILMKTECANRTEAAAWALRRRRLTGGRQPAAARNSSGRS